MVKPWCLCHSKGSKTSLKVPHIEYVETDIDGYYSCEKDVEEKLIIPLIRKLGYTENDYKRQMYVEIGNHNNTLIPDFVLLPNERRSASGFAVIEAKRSISSLGKFKEVLVQAKSYAKLLTTKYCCVAAQEKLWITERRDGYDSIVFEATWEQLNDTDVFYELNKIIGK